MGIEGLIPFLKGKNNPQCMVVQTMPMSSIRKRRLAVDVSTQLYSHMSTAYKKISRSMNLMNGKINQHDLKLMWIDSLLHRLSSLQRMECELILVFDGKAPDMKTKTRADRRAIRKKLAEDIDRLWTQLNNTLPLDRTYEMIEELRTMMGKQNHVPEEYAAEFKQLVTGLGYVVVQATGEADRTCASLCREGIVDAVLSTDSDLLTHGCPVLISKILKDGLIEAIRLDAVLYALQLSLEQFQELCIISKCDYNDGIPGKTIKSLYPIYRHYQSYQVMVMYNPPINCKKLIDYSDVNMSECKLLFEIMPSCLIMEQQIQPPTYTITNEARRTLGETYKEIGYHISIIEGIYRNQVGGQIGGQSVDQVGGQMITDFANL